MNNGHTIRSACRQARATYRPDWSESAPFVTYIRGTAMRHHQTERGALAFLESRGFQFRITQR